MRRAWSYLVRSSPTDNIDQNKNELREKDDEETTCEEQVTEIKIPDDEIQESVAMEDNKRVDDDIQCDQNIAAKEEKDVEAVENDQDVIQDDQKENVKSATICSDPGKQSIEPDKERKCENEELTDSEARGDECVEGDAFEAVDEPSKIDETPEEKIEVSQEVSNEVDLKHESTEETSKINNVERDTTDNEEIRSISDYDDEEWDEEDPFGFEADREQEALLEAFRLGFDEESKDHQQQDDNRMRGADSPIKRIAANKLYSEVDETIEETEKDHPHKALFDILDRNFDDLDSFHVPLVNRLITADDIKVFFVAFVVVFTQPKPFEFAQKYNQDIPINEIVIPPSFDENHNTSTVHQRRGWLFRRNKNVHAANDEANCTQESNCEINEKQSKSEDESHRFVNIPYDAVFALWVQVANELGVIKDLDLEFDSMTLIMNHVEESLIELGLLEIESQKIKISSFHMQDASSNDHESSSVSVDSQKSNRYNDSKRESKFYMIRHAINEQYGIYLAKSQSENMIEKVNKSKETWFQVVAKVHNDISKEIDTYQLILLPYICARGNQVARANDLLTNVTFYEERFSVLGVLQCITTYMTDIDFMIKSREPPNDIYNFCNNVCSTLWSQIEASIAEAQKDSGNIERSRSMNHKEMNLIVESSKALHLMALTFGSFGYITKELEYHVESIKMKELWMKSTNESAIAQISLSDSYHCMGVAYDNVGDFEEAITCYDRALTTRRSLLGNNHLKVAETCHGMGSLLCEQNELDSAQLLLEEALQIRKYHLSDRDSLVADTEQWLGNLMRELGHLDEALDYFKSALVGKKAKVGNNHEDVADAMHNMAIILDDMQKHELSIGCYQEALRIREMIYDRENIMVADTLLCLGNAYKITKKNQKAISHIKESIDIREKILAPYDGLNDDSLIMCLEDLSDDLLAQHKGLIDCYAELHPLLEKVSTKKVHENDSLGVNMTEEECLHQMGNIYATMRCWDEAYERYEAALALKSDSDLDLVIKIGLSCVRRDECEIGKERLCDVINSIETHPSNKSFVHYSLLYTIAVTYFNLQQYEAAISSLNQSLKILTSCPGPINEGNTYHWIGRCYFEMQDYSKATNSILLSLKIYNDHRADVKEQVILRTLHLLGNTHFKNKQIKLALKCYEEEISLFKNSIADVSSYNDCLSEAYYCAGLIHAKKGSLENASAYLETALQTRKRFQGEENKKVAKILHKLGTIYLEKKEYESAKKKLVDAYYLLCKIQGPNDEFTAVVEFKLGKTLHFLDESDTAMLHYKNSLESMQNYKSVEDEEIANIWFHMGKNASMRQHFDESIEFLEKALDIRRKVHSINHDLIAVVLFELGKSYNEEKSMDKSLLCYREALRIWKLIPDDTSAAAASFVIAEIFERDNKINLAIKHYSECITLTPNSDYSKMHLLQCRLGDLHEQNGELEKSVLQFESSRQTLNGNENEDEKLVITLQSLSRVYSRLNRFDDALQCNKDLVSLQSDSTSLADVFHSMGNTYFALGQHNEALEYLKKSVSIHKTNPDPDVMSMAIGLMDLAKVNECIDDHKGSYDNLVEAMRIFKLKREKQSTIKVLDNLAKINESMHQLDEAKECLEECIALKMDYFGEQNLDLSNSLHQFGCLCKKTQDYSESLEHLKTALKIRKQVLGLDHEDTASTIMQIGEIYFGQEQYDASLKCFNQILPVLKALESNQTRFDEWLVCHSFIGTIHFKVGRFELAITFLREAIQCEDFNFHMGVPIHDTLHYIGTALQFIQKQSEAIPFLKRAILKRKTKFGVNSRQYVESMAILGECCYDTCNYDEAMTYSSKALDVLRAKKFSDDALFAQTQICVGKVLTTKENYVDALKLFDSSMELYEDSQSNFDEEKATIYLLKGKVYAKQEGRLNLAIEQFKKCLDLRKKLYNDSETDSVAEVLMEVGVVLHDKGELSSSLNCFLEVLKLRKQFLKKGRMVAVAAYKIGHVLYRLGRFDEAMKYLEDARNDFSVDDDNYPLDIANLNYSIGLVLKELNRFDEALHMFEDAINTLKDQDDDDCFTNCHYQVAILKAEKDKMATKYLLNALELLRGNSKRNKVKIADILIRLGDIHKNNGEDREAMPLFSEAVTIYERTTKKADLAYSLLQIGNLYMKADKLDKSFPMYQKAWELHKQNTLDEKDLASILYGLGFIYNQRFQHKDAMDVLKNSLKIRLRLLGKTSLEVARTCEQLGTALVSLTRFEDALKVCTTALDIYRNELGENHICCARVMLDIGTIYCQKENYDLSLVQLQACLQFFRKECGEASEEVANVLLRIGQIHDLRVDHDEAMKCMTNALEIRTEIYGRNDVRVAETMLNIARVLQDWGDTDEAMDCFQNALGIYQQCKEDCLSAEVYNEIGSMYCERSEFEKALEAYKKALTIFKEKIGQKSTEVGNTLRNLGAAYDALNDITTSFKYYSDSLNILTHNLGKEDLGVALVLNNLGINLARRNEYNKALEFCKEALLIRRKLLPNGHLDIADTLFNIANILDDKGDQNEQALKFYSESLLQYRMNFGDDNEDVANCNKSMGLIHMKRGESTEALKKISEALRVFRLKHGDSNIDVASLLYSLGRLFGKQARYEKALACFSECLKIRNELLGELHEESVATKRFVIAIQRKMNSGR